jgi:hypothetical protein
MTGIGFAGVGGGGPGRTGMDCDWLSCIRSIVGGAGLEVCPDRFETTIVLMAVNDSSIRTFLFIKNSVVIVCASSPPT